MGTDVKKGIAGGDPWATYRETEGNTVVLYPLASEDSAGMAGAFADLEQAIRGAKLFVFIADWSFQPYVRLKLSSPADVTSTLGYLLTQKAAQDGVLVAVHTWNHTNIGSPDPQNDDGGARLDAIAGAFDPKLKQRPANLLWRMSSRTGVGYSHHQKFVVLDADGPGGKRHIKAFFGGLDITQGRFDWTEHPILAGPGASWRAPVVHANVTYDDWYSQEFSHGARKFDPKTGKPGRDAGPGDLDMPRQPWQDYYAQIDGPSAWDVLREFVGRWLRDHGSASGGDTSDTVMDTVSNMFVGLFKRGDLVKPWEKQDGPFVARVVRSLEADHWGAKDSLFAPDVIVEGEKGKQKELVWTVSGTFEKSIQESYLRAIRRAERFIYIESQYFIGSGPSWTDTRGSVANGIPRAIADRIVAKINADKPFHAYIVIPMFPEGDPVSAVPIVQRNFEQRTMEFMSKQVFKAARDKGKDWRDYLSFYFVTKWDRAPDGTAVLAKGTRRERVSANQRYMIYVHSKLMIMDDEYLILGSANLNERSLAGNRDSEICVYLRPGEGRIDDCRSAIKGLRERAWIQHFGGKPSGFDNPEQSTCVWDVRNRAREAWAQLRTRGGTTCRLCSIPWRVQAQTPPSGKEVITFDLEPISAVPGEDPFLVDAAAVTPAASAPEWLFRTPIVGAAATVASHTDLAE